MNGAALGHGLCASSLPLAQVYDTAVLDLDGVVYVGDAAVADAPRHLARAEAAGMALAFVTNNASRTPAEVAGRLTRIGVRCAPADVVTSAQAAARLLAHRLPDGSRVLVVGGGGLVSALEEHGLVAVSGLDDGPAAVVQGFHPDVGWRLLAEGAAGVARGLPWVATNTDLTLPSPRGPEPGNGTLVEVIARTTGRRPEVAGKPQTPLFEETRVRVGGRRPLVVGDRLDTDIDGAVRVGADSLLVLTGVTDVATLAAAPAGSRPGYVARDLEGLLRPHPAARVGGGAVTCGGWTARSGPAPGDTGLRLRGEGDPDHALRALVALCWARADAGEPPCPPEAVDTAWRAVPPAR